MFPKISPLRAAAFLGPLALWPVTAEAQSMWIDSPGPSSVQLEVIRPVLDEQSVDLGGFAFYLSGRWSVGEAAAIVTEVPFAHGNTDTPIRSESDNTVGNPYLGLELSRRGSPLTGALGVRVPLAADRNLGSALGFAADAVDREEAFLPDVLSLHGAVRYEYRAPTGLTLTGLLAPIVWVDVGDALADNSELFLGYAAKIGYVGEAFAVSGGFSGRGLVTESGNLADRTIHQAVLSASLALDRYRPGVQIRLPIDEDMRNLLDWVISFSFGVRVP